MASNYINAQLSPNELMLLENLPQNISSALNDTRVQPSAKADDRLNDAVRMNNLNAKRNLTFDDRYTKQKHLTPYNIGIQKDLKLFGYDLFTGLPYSYFFNEEVALPEDYVLQIGDLLEFQVYGMGNMTDGVVNELRVTQNGMINLPYIGTIKAQGKKISSLNSEVKSEFLKRYPGSMSYLSVTSTSLISVFLSGEVISPGAYAIRNLSRITNLLSMAGGMKDSASLRYITVTRIDGTIYEIDLYKLLIDPDGTVLDISLRNGDIINVPIAKRQVAVMGAVKREGVYEIKSNESFDDLIKYAGGLKPYASSSGLYIHKDGALNFSNIASPPKDFEIEDGSILYQNFDQKFSTSSVEIIGLTNSLSLFDVNENTKLSNLIDFDS
ncbi:MAG: SLBB domain-containing protein, partial [Proteobacteria bacterium]|nr:SLBB domain-containing protein [Pseudomonadota bacterium]